jgi:hypothetical protein
MTQRKPMLSLASFELLAFVTSRGTDGATMRHVRAAFPNRDRRSLSQALNNMLQGGYVRRAGRGPGARWGVAGDCRKPDGTAPTENEAFNRDLAARLATAAARSGEHDAVGAGGQDEEDDDAPPPVAVVTVPFAPASVFNLGLLVDPRDVRDFDSEAVVHTKDAAPVLARASVAVMSQAWPFPKSPALAACPPAEPERSDSTTAEDEFDCSLDVNGVLMILDGGSLVELQPSSVAKLAGYLAAIDVQAILTLSKWTVA